MDDTVEIMKKSFSPERKAVQAEVLELVRAVQMGKGNKMELARAITELAKSELEVKRSDPDLKISVDQNMGMLNRAMKAVTGMSEGITEDEIEEYKSLASLRNRSSLDALARLQDRNKPKTPKVIQIPKGTQLDLFKKAAGESVEESLTEALKVGDKVKAKKGSMKSPSQQHYERTVGTIVKVYSDGDVKVNFGGNDNFSVPGKLLVKTQVEESLTEAEFDEAAGEKDACYRKVKSRYKVWPSAYASGALVKCRKVGAANWGNSKKK